MNVSQMLAHCNVILETAMGRNFPKRIFIGKLIGPFFKTGLFKTEKPFPKNTPTDTSYVISNEQGFDAEKSKILGLIQEFYDGGPAKCTAHPHPFYGKLTPEEWSVHQFKHLDHHLRQFGA